MIPYFKFVRVAVKTDPKTPHMATRSYCACQGHAHTTGDSRCDFDNATCVLSSRDMGHAQPKCCKGFQTPSMSELISSLSSNKQSGDGTGPRSGPHLDKCCSRVVTIPGSWLPQQRSRHSHLILQCLAFHSHSSHASSSHPLGEARCHCMPDFTCPLLHQGGVTCVSLKCMNNCIPATILRMCFLRHVQIG